MLYQRIAFQYLILSGVFASIYHDRQLAKFALCQSRSLKRDSARKEMQLIDPWLCLIYCDLDIYSMSIDTMVKVQITVSIILASCLICNAQEKSILDHDTLYYKGEKYYKGQIVIFSNPVTTSNAKYYGSDWKIYSYIWLGSGAGLNKAHAPIGYSMMEAEIIKIKKHVWVAPRIQEYFIVVDMFVGQHLPIHNFFSDQKRRDKIPSEYKSLSDYTTFTIYLQGAVNNNEILIKKLR
jgi:hypothetical protein